MRWFKVGLLLTTLFISPLAYAEGEKVDLVPLDVSINNGQVDVATTATKIPSTPLSGRKAITVINTSTTTVYLGSSSVTTSNGYQLKQDAQVSIDIGENVDLYGIVGSSTSDVRFIEAR